MKKIIAVAASLLVNLVAIAALNNSANDAAPPGEVVVTELSIESDIALAQTAFAAAAL